MSKSKEFGNQPQQIVQQEVKTQTSPERQTLPSVFDVLERKAQLKEERERVSKQLGPYVTRARRAFLFEYSDKEYHLGKELRAVHDFGTDRDRLIIDVYTTMNKFESGESAPWHRDLVFPEEIRQFISRVAPMSEDELREELRKAQEALERKTRANRKRRETRIRQKGLTWAERHEKLRESARRYQQERRKQRKLQAEQQQLTEVFPDHPKK
jgi:hypothetical protein